MTNTIKKLESKGFIDIAPDETSGRNKKITLTAEGRKARDRAVHSCGLILTDVAGEFPVSELKKHLPFLRKLRSYLDERRYRA